MRVLVTGDRKGFYDPRLRAVLDHILNEIAGGEMVLIHGASVGVDAQAEEWALRQRGVTCIQFPAQWSTEGLRAGPKRNSLMLSEGKPELVVAFHHNPSESKGTADMINKAEKAGVKVWVFTE